MQTLPNSQEEGNNNLLSRIPLIILVILSAVSFCVGVIHILNHGVNGEYISALNSYGSSPDSFFTETSWQSNCAPQSMQIHGIGMGNNNTITNPQTLNLSKHVDTGEHFWVQVVSLKYNNKNFLPPESVTLSLNSGDEILLIEPSLLSHHSYSYSTNDTNTAPFNQITATIKGNANSVRGLIAYAFQESPDTLWTSIGQIMNEYVSVDNNHITSCMNKGCGNIQNSYSVVLPLTNPTSTTSDIDITAVIIDNDDDERPFIVEAKTDSGIATTSGLITTPSNGHRLNIVNFTVPNVPTDTGKITVTLKSPLPNGDSVIFGGVNINYPCSSTPPPPPKPHEVYLPIIMQPLNLRVNLEKSPVLGTVNFPITHTVSVMNPHTSITAENVKLVYPLPPGFKINWSPSQNWDLSTCPSPSDVTECILGDIQPGETVTASFFFIPEQAGSIPLRVSAIGISNTGGGIHTTTDITKCTPEFSQNSPFNNDNFNLYWGPLINDIEYCAGTEDHNDYYYLVLPSGGNLRVRVKYRGLIMNTYIPVLQGAIYSNPPNPSNPINYSTKNGGDFQFDTSISNPGIYYLRIFAKDPDPNVSYTMTIRFSP